MSAAVVASPAEGQTAERGRRAAHIARGALVVVLVGAALRLAAYFSARSLWLDEAMLANNIVGRTFVGLLGPLGENQSAPWLFLFGERATAMLLGPNELALRLLPLIAGILLPWIVWLTASKLADRETGIIAAAIAVLSPLLLYYSNEVKPYGTDALVSATLVFVTLCVLENAADRRRWFILLFAGGVGLVAAFPAAFILPACWAALLASANVRRSPHARRMLSATAVAWAATFALPYLLVIRRATSDAFLTTYFSDRFLVPWRPDAFAALWGLWHDVSAEAFLGHDALAGSPGAIAVVLSVVILGVCGGGLWEIWRRRGASGVLLMTGPVAIALLASTIRVYPLTARLWTFATPLCAMLAAAGVRAVATRARPDMTLPTSIAVTVCLLAIAGVDAAVGLTDPHYRRAHMRPLIRLLEDEQRSTGDPIYIMPRAAPQWLFYTTAWRSDPAPIPLDSAGRWLEQRTCEPKGAQRARACQMLGAYSSVMYTEAGGFSGQADSSWADREVLRLRAAAAPCGWVVMHMAYAGEPVALARAVATHGGYVRNAIEGVFTLPPLASRAERMRPNRDPATRAIRICFDRPISGP